MAMQTNRPSPSRPLIIYAAVMIVALSIVAVGATIWLSTGNSGTNVLATDEKAMSHTP
jgi:flagellar basal body-associated protein FliL